MPLSHCYYHLKKDIELNCLKYNCKDVEFRSKHEQSIYMLCYIVTEFFKSDILVATDSWFGNNGMWKPLHKELGDGVHLISRLRSNNNLFDEPSVPTIKRRGRPRKHCHKLGTASTLAYRQRILQQENSVNLYGKERTLKAYDKVIMLKSLKCQIRVVWVYRKTQWVAFFFCRPDSIGRRDC
nr:transposase [Desulforhopalus sp. IMCC35007]